MATVLVGNCVTSLLIVRPCGPTRMIKKNHGKRNGFFCLKDASNSWHNHFWRRRQRHVWKQMRDEKRLDPAMFFSQHLTKKLFTLLDLCVSSLRRGHANRYVA